MKLDRASFILASSGFVAVQIIPLFTNAPNSLFLGIATYFAIIFLTKLSLISWNIAKGVETTEIHSSTIGEIIGLGILIAARSCVESLWEVSQKIL